MPDQIHIETTFSDWKVSFANYTRKIHELMCLMAVIIFPVFAFFDYYTTSPGTFWPLTTFRLSISATIGIWLLLQRKYNLNERFLTMFAFLSVSWFCCFACAFSPEPFLYQHNVAFSTVFLAASLFIVWSWYYSVTVVITNILLYSFLIIFFTPFSLGNVLLEGGSVCLTMMLLHPIIIYFRYRSHKREYLLRTKLSDSYLQLKISKAEAEDRNEELAEAREKLDDANKELKGINHHLEDLVLSRTLTLESTNTQLHKALDELDNFLYGSFHDLKGPIARLKGLMLLSASCGENNGILTEFNIRSLDTIKEMEQMMDKLKRISDIYHSKIVMEDINLLLLVNEVIEKLNVPSQNIKTEISPDSVITTDRTAFTTIFENILENSLKYNCEARPLSIRIYTTLTARGFVINIEDNGDGIAPSIIDKVFLMFYRGNEKSKGHGLGLYITKRAVEKLNGSIEIESEENVFTRSKLFLPSV